ncbi:S10 family peptidase [Nonomuraea bangladeshensis]|uniref:S10 family peptidase n=1 Tax=Nonomuraea bangladeshensis TaxID=404385 RepID=UPI0031CF9BC2
MDTENVDPSAAQAPAEPVASAPRSSYDPARPRAPRHDVPPPRQFVTSHEAVIGGETINFTVTAGETYLYTDHGDPIGAVFSYAYVKDGAPAGQRPVVFITGGGPGAASNVLQIGVLGPWAVPTSRLEIVDGRQPSPTPPYDFEDNPDSLLDTADLVFIDTVGTGHSRVVGTGTGADFWGVDEDADMTAQFIHTWITKNGRWNSPKFFLGESYGGTRAALVTTALMGSPWYQGYSRAIALNGVICLVNGLGLPLGNEGVGPAALTATRLPAFAATAWHHQVIDRRGRSLEEYFEEAYRFACGEYLDALVKEAGGALPASERADVVKKAAEFTAVPVTALEGTLGIDEFTFARTVLAGQGRAVGVYDSRYTSPLGGAGDVILDDAALSRFFPVTAGVFNNLEKTRLGVEMDQPYTTIAWRGLLETWNFARRPQVYGDGLGKGTTADDLALAMRRNESLHLMVGSGYFDLVAGAGLARYAVEQAGMPQDRLVVRNYYGGHEPYLDSGNRHVLAEDLRQFIRKAAG